LLSTYCGFYVAIPHGISETVKEPGVCFARIPEISWGPEQEKVRYVFLLAVPKIDDNRQSPHLKLLSAIAVSSLEEDIREIWANASSEVEILESLKPALNGPEND
jgi:PTS system fructose-specific IIA component